VIIHSHRERDRLIQEQQKQLDEAHKRHMESLDALDAAWQASRDHNQEVIDRTTRGMVDINHVEFTGDEDHF
jgi:hypothetical protein